MRLSTALSLQRTIRSSITPPKPFTALTIKFAPTYKARKMSSGSGDLGIENTNIKTASGVSLDDHQKTLVGSVLDLFAGRPSLKKLQLWADDGVFEDPITIAEGPFSEIERLSHEVTDAGNPIAMDLKTRYVMKGVGKEQTIASKILIYYDQSTGKITKLQDKWDGQLPDSSFKNSMVVAPLWRGVGLVDVEFYLEYVVVAGAFRNLNSVTVPKMVSVPKNDEEDAKRGNQ
ncbi:MAG: hypothetical protein LQ347_000163 [Umbilicaria vellea]|nr:MAG: hypothetical protein LQ347_000163 [Umbilicaria vellea]